MRVLAIDYSDARTGIAVSDPILTAPDKPAAVAGVHSYFEE